MEWVIKWKLNDNKMKLTHYISIRYIGATILVMLISIPVFYLVLQNVLTHSIDENLELQKEIITSKLQKIDPQNFIILENGVSIEKSNEIIEDEIFYTKEIYNQAENEREDFRFLDFTVKNGAINYKVEIRQSLVETTDLLNTILKLLLSILGILTATLLIINYLVKKNIWNPFYQTLAQLKNFRIDNNQELQLEKSKINELNDLNSSLNELSATNRKVYQSQKEFTENASHEIQTPLAIVQNNLELFWQTENISENQALILNEISTATSRMSKLNQSLLLLSKIENKQFSETENVNLNRLVDNFLKNYQEQIKFKELYIKTQLSKFFIVKINANLAEILVNNLLLNSLKYAPKGSEVIVAFTENEMSISNKSNAGSLDKNLLFKRFQRQNNQETGTGLGLEIAKQIATSFDLKLIYVFRENQHCFILKRI